MDSVPASRISSKETSVQSAAAGVPMTAGSNRQTAASEPVATASRTRITLDVLERSAADWSCGYSKPMTDVWCRPRFQWRSWQQNRIPLHLGLNRLNIVNPSSSNMIHFPLFSPIPPLCLLYPFSFRIDYDNSGHTELHTHLRGTEERRERDQIK
ncbi:hypothetical protein MSAN_01729800 [Mycena sanguinolenta]|uniref:Uncharacterized protein n=1 Tax=Mycena sanguinolenta TaxID=230812 RepID=A0A8H6Y069_9AGAR|nr:hypothetical protein MSAN_01729800 [Mycena sanguinolenta]